MQTETSYLGFRLPHPFIAGASLFGHHLDTVRRLEDPFHDPLCAESGS